MRRFAPLALSAVVLLTFSAMAMAGDAPAAGAAPASNAKALSVLDLYFHSMPVGGLLTILSLLCFSLSIQWTLTLKRDTFIPPGMADDVHNCFAEGVTDEAIENARNVVGSDTSFLGNVLASALDKRDFGYEAMKEAAESVGISEHNKYISKVGWLSMFSSSATLLGLLGTVTGIIGSFLKMASSPGGVDASTLAANIGEALVCTAMGLFVAIVGLYFFFFLRGRVNQAAIDVGVIATEVLDYFRPQQAH
jgi:biopolymer transport protein ExbB